MMQRQYSDPALTSAPHLPRRPSTLGPERLTGQTQTQRQRSGMAVVTSPVEGGKRGTVSLPTSPVRLMSEGYPWDDVPQTAQPHHLNAQSSYIQDHGPPQSQPHPLTDPLSAYQTPYDPPQSMTEGYNYQPNDEYTPTPDHSNHHEMDVDYFPPDEEQEQRQIGGAGRKKRAQVRIACTHCQKACKKCSNTRPCDRCKKYGLEDCVDSTRRPRKTGVKRGPYRRRNSKYGYSSISATRYGPSQTPSLEYENQTQTMQGHIPVPSPRPRAAAMRWINGQRIPMDPGDLDEERMSEIDIKGGMSQGFSRNPNRIANEDENENEHGILPDFPMVMSDTQAQSQSLPYPPWTITTPQYPNPNTSSYQLNHHPLMNSQSPRGMRMTGGPSTRRPSIYTGFPMALDSSDDPFSRAVSPIRQGADVFGGHYGQAHGNRNEHDQAPLPGEFESHNGMRTELQRLADTNRAHENGFQLTPDTPQGVDFGSHPLLRNGGQLSISQDMVRRPQPPPELRKTLSSQSTTLQDQNQDQDITPNQNQNPTRSHDRESQSQIQNSAQESIQSQKQNVNLLRNQDLQDQQIHFHPVNGQPFYSAPTSPLYRSTTIERGNETDWNALRQSLQRSLSQVPTGTLPQEELDHLGQPPSQDSNQNQNLNSDPTLVQPSSTVVEAQNLGQIDFQFDPRYQIQDAPQPQHNLHGTLSNVQTYMSPMAFSPLDIHSPGLGPGPGFRLGFTKIRKPSLRTLMIGSNSSYPGSSTYSSRAVSPAVDDDVAIASQSPTLFDQPMDMSFGDGEEGGFEIGSEGGLMELDYGRGGGGRSRRLGIFSKLGSGDGNFTRRDGNGDDYEEGNGRRRSALGMRMGERYGYGEGDRDRVGYEDGLGHRIGEEIQGLNDVWGKLLMGTDNDRDHGQFHFDGQGRGRGHDDVESGPKVDIRENKEGRTGEEGMLIDLFPSASQGQGNQAEDSGMVFEIDGNEVDKL